MNIKKTYIIFILALLIAFNIAFIWSRSMYSKNSSAAQSGSVVESVTSIIPILEMIPFEVLDIAVRKIAHFAEFASLGALSAIFTYLTFGGTFRDFMYNSALTAMLCLLVASTDETIQLFSGRGDQLSDVLLDFCGAVFGIFFVSVIIFIYSKRKKRN